MKLPTGFALLAALALAFLPQLALACGMPLEARITYERALLVVNGTRQQMIASVEISEAQPDAAVILPVPGLPEVDQPAGGGELFAYLNDATRPLVEVQTRYLWGSEDERATGGAAPGGAVLIGREVLGGYDVARLAADDAGALQAWLDTNRYTVPPAAQSILAAYVAEGWSFVAVKLAANAPNGSLDPLRISYDAERVVYPMRLGSLSDRPVGVDLYLLADHRMLVPELETLYAGPATQLSPAPAAELGDLLGAASYLTRLRSDGLSPASLAADFVATEAPDDTPFRKVVVEYDEVYLLNTTTRTVIGVSCILVASFLATISALLIRRRLNAIPRSRKRRT